MRTMSLLKFFLAHPPRRAMTWSFDAEQVLDVVADLVGD